MISTCACAVKWLAIRCTWRSLIGLGFRHLSMNGRTVARVKCLRHINEQDEARELAARSLEAPLAAEVRHQVAAFMEQAPGSGGLIRGGR
ncbi:hypothetical protein ACNKHS_16940 [Shigella flexneri]